MSKLHYTQKKVTCENEYYRVSVEAVAKDIEDLEIAESFNAVHPFQGCLLALGWSEEAVKKVFLSSEKEEKEL